LKCGYQNEVYSSKAPTSFSRGPLAASNKNDTMPTIQELRNKAEELKKKEDFENALPLFREIWEYNKCRLTILSFYHSIKNIKILENEGKRENN
jgi:hypothetical protein